MTPLSSPLFLNGSRASVSIPFRTRNSVSLSAEALHEHVSRGDLCLKTESVLDEIYAAPHTIFSCRSITMLFYIAGVDSDNRLLPLRQCRFKIKRWVVLDHNFRVLFGIRYCLFNRFLCCPNKIPSFIQTLCEPLG